MLCWPICGTRLVAVLCAGTLLSAAGCVQSKPIPVSGKVTVGGQPLAKGTVTFHPDESKGNKAKLASPPVGDIENGEYKVGAGKEQGVPPGWYKVTVYATVPSDPKDEYSEPMSLISETYNSPETTTLSVEVKPNAPPGAYDLVLTK